MKINHSKCDVCGVCVAVCPVDAVTVSEFKVTIDNNVCINCQNCLITCPATAITDEIDNESAALAESMDKESTAPLGLKDEYDVVVVGAGPAGSVTARFAVENNASVLMLERDREAGIPVRCAEGISGGGLDTFVKLDKRLYASRISRARLYTPDGNHLEMSSNLNGYVLERRLFDAALCDVACSKGAKMLTKADVIGAERTSDGKMKVNFIYRGEKRQVVCKILIGADGVESRVGRWVGLKTDLALQDISTSTQYTLNNIRVDSDLISFYFGNEVAPGGYIWVFPKSETSANVGLGIAGSFAKNKSAKKYLDEFIERTFPDASISYTVYSGVPIAETLENFIADNVMLVGDAARQVNPITGGGIKQAMIAGKIAGVVAAEAVQKGNYTAKALAKYPKEWDKALGSKHRFIYKIKEKVLKASDEKLNKIANMCKDIPPDKITLTELFKVVIKGDPKLIGEMASAFILSKISF